MAPSLEVGMSSDRLVSYDSQGLRKKYLLDGDKTKAKPKQEHKAEIKYHPNRGQYLARAEARVHVGGLEQDVPVGWPKVLTGPLVWTTTDVQNEADYIHVLTDDEKVEIDSALKHFKGDTTSYTILSKQRLTCLAGLEVENQQVNPENFPLPILASTLEKMRGDLYQGRGFAILRGLDPDAFAEDDATLIYLAVSTYIGNRIGKHDPKGHAISRYICFRNRHGDSDVRILVHVVRREEEPDDNSQVTLRQEFRFLKTYFLI